MIRPIECGFATLATLRGVVAVAGSVAVGAAPVAAGPFALAGTSSSAGADIGPVVESRSFVLENGLQVILTPGGEGRTASIAVLFSIGELHDPPGRSGMARLCEQLYCTAAVGAVPARSAEDIRRRYPAGSIDQAFSDHSVIGVMFPPDRLAQELGEAAVRLAGVRLEQADLERELDRVAMRIRRWGEERPAYAAMHRAMTPISPLPEGARIGGDLDQIRRAGLEEIRARLDRLYKPANATLAVAGPFDADEVEAIIRSAFGRIPSGERAVAAAPRPPPMSPAAPIRRIMPAPEGAMPECHAAVAVRPPLLDDRDSVAFVFLVQRLMELEERDGHLDDPTGPAMQAYLLDPNAALVVRRSCAPPGEWGGRGRGAGSGTGAGLGGGAGMGAGAGAGTGTGTGAGAGSRAAAGASADGSPEAVLAAIVERMQGAAEMTPEEFESLRRRLRDGGAWMTGESAIPLRMLTRNPYGVAYALGRQRQLGLDPAQRAAALEALDLGELFDACRRIFAAPRLSRAIIVTEPGAMPDPAGADAP